MRGSRRNRHIRPFFLFSFSFFILSRPPKKSFGSHGRLTIATIPFWPAFYFHTGLITNSTASDRIPTIFPLLMNHVRIPVVIQQNTYQYQSMPTKRVFFVRNFFDIPLEYNAVYVTVNGETRDTGCCKDGQERLYDFMTYRKRLFPCSIRRNLYLYRIIILPVTLIIACLSTLM